VEVFLPAQVNKYYNLMKPKFRLNIEFVVNFMLIMIPMNCWHLGGSKIENSLTKLEGGMERQT
jgi:hypothetical protein